MKYNKFSAFTLAESNDFTFNIIIYFNQLHFLRYLQGDTIILLLMKFGHLLQVILIMMLYNDTVNKVYSSVIYWFDSG